MESAATAHVAIGPAQRLRWSGFALFAWCVITVGALARELRYLDARSLWGDEASLAMNLIERDALALLGPLSNQYAPILLLLANKTAMLVFGTGELALRLVPLLAALAALPLFAWLATRTLTRVEAGFALLLFALSDSLVFYGSELKQYSTDVFVSLVLLAGAIRIARDGVTRERLFAFALAGVLSVWASHPAIFVCAGLGTVLIANAWHAGRRSDALALIAVAGCWAASFMVEYFAFLRPAYQDRDLLEFWAGDTLPFLPRTQAELTWLPRTLFQFFNDPAGLASAWIAAPLFLVGAWCLWRRERALLVLLLAPLATTLLASGFGFFPFPTSAEPISSLHLYPYLGRLILFTVPFALLVLGCGLGVLAEFARRRPKFGIVALVPIALLLVPTLHVFAKNATSPPRIQEPRPLMVGLADRLEAGDQLLVQSFATTMTRYYAHRLGIEAPIVEVSGRSPQELAAFTELLAQLPPGSRVWLVTIHHPNWDSAIEQRHLLERLDRAGRRVEPLRSYRAAAILYRIGGT